jgi:hypothetical protein
MKNKAIEIDTLIIAQKLSPIYLNKFKNQNKKYLFLALDPISQIILKEKNIEFLTSKNFLDYGANKSILVSSQKVLSKYQKYINCIKIGPINEAFINYVNFRLLFKAREWLIIEHIIKKIKTRNIIYLGSDYSLFSFLSSWCKFNGIILTTSKNLSNKKNINCLKRKLSSFVKVLIFEIFFLMYKYFFKNKKKIILSNNHNNLIAIENKINDISHSFLKIHLTSSLKYIFFRKKEFFTGKFFSFCRISGLILNRDKCEFLYFKNNLDLALCSIRKLENQKIQNIESAIYVALNKFIDENIKEELINLFRFYIGLKRIFKITNDKMLVIAQHGLGINGILGELSYHFKIPSLLVTHGSHVEQKEKYTKLAWNETHRSLINAKFDYTAIQTPLAKKYFQKEKEKKAVPIDTGPLIFGIKNSQSDNDKSNRKAIFKEKNKNFIFLHASTPKPFDTFRPIIYESIDEYVSNIIDIINSIKKSKDIYLAIRFRESENLTLNSFKKLLPRSDSYGIYTDGKFSEYLKNCDCLISYSSTTIEESLINKKPVLIYNPNSNYFYLDGTILSPQKHNSKIDVVYNVKNKADLTWSLNWIKSKYDKKSKSLSWDQYSFNSNEIIPFRKLINKIYKVS